MRTTWLYRNLHGKRKSNNKKQEKWQAKSKPFFYRSRDFTIKSIARYLPGISRRRDTHFPFHSFFTTEDCTHYIINTSIKKAYKEHKIINKMESFLIWEPKKKRLYKQTRHFSITSYMVSCNWRYKNSVPRSGLESNKTNFNKFMKETNLVSTPNNSNLIPVCRECVVAIRSKSTDLLAQLRTFIHRFL